MQRRKSATLIDKRKGRWTWRDPRVRERCNIVVNAAKIVCGKTKRQRRHKQRAGCNCCENSAVQIPEKA